MTWLPSPPVGSRVVVVGDLHGSISDLHRAGLAYHDVHRELCPIARQTRHSAPFHSISMHGVSKPRLLVLGAKCWSCAGSRAPG